MADWVHCNKCFTQPSMASACTFQLTSCGHILCDKCYNYSQQVCRKAGKPLHCIECSKGPIKIMAINSSMDKNVRQFFLNTDQLWAERSVKLRKICQFQTQQVQSLVRFSRIRENEINTLKVKNQRLEKDLDTSRQQLSHHRSYDGSFQQQRNTSATSSNTSRMSGSHTSNMSAFFCNDSRTSANVSASSTSLAGGGGGIGQYRRTSSPSSATTTTSVMSATQQRQQKEKSVSTATAASPYSTAFGGDGRSASVSFSTLSRRGLASSTHKSPSSRLNTSASGMRLVSLDSPLAFSGSRKFARNGSGGLPADLNTSRGSSSQTSSGTVITPISYVPAAGALKPTILASYNASSNNNNNTLNSSRTSSSSMSGTRAGGGPVMAGRIASGFILPSSSKNFLNATPKK